MIDRVSFPISSGYNDISQYPDWQNGEARAIENYEITVNGQLNKRSTPLVFDEDLNSQIETWGWSVISFKVCYLTYLPKDINPLNQYIILFYVISNEHEYVLNLVYKSKSFGWTYTGDGGSFLAGLPDLVSYNNKSNLVYWISANRVLITDGVNKGHYINIDKDGVIGYGYLGVVSPRNKPIVSYDTSTSNFVSTETTIGVGMGIEKGVLISYAYTIIDKNGVESNPSPVFNQTKQMYFHRDVSDEENIIGFKEYWKSVVINDLKVPDNYPTSKKKEIEYFGLYRQISYGTEDSRVPDEFTRVALIPVADTSFNIASPFSQWTDSAATGLKFLSYDNDICPACENIVETNGVKFISNPDTSLSFIFDFKKYFEIKLTNNNNQYFKEATICVRINMNENFMKNISTEFSSQSIRGTSTSSGDKEYLFVYDFGDCRIVDSDLTTICPVSYLCMVDRRSAAGSFENPYHATGDIDFYITVPNMLPNSLKIIYFCWNGNIPDWAKASLIKNDTQDNKYINGMFLDIYKHDTFNNFEFYKNANFDFFKPRTQDNVAVTDLEYEGEADKVRNRGYLGNDFKLLNCNILSDAAALSIRTVNYRLFNSSVSEQKFERRHYFNQHAFPNLNRCYRMVIDGFTWGDKTGAFVESAVPEGREIKVFTCGGFVNITKIQIPPVTDTYYGVLFGGQYYTGAGNHYSGWNVSLRQSGDITNVYFLYVRRGIGVTVLSLGTFNFVDIEDYFFIFLSVDIPNEKVHIKIMNDNGSELLENTRDAEDMNESFFYSWNFSLGAYHDGHDVNPDLRPIPITAYGQFTYVDGIYTDKKIDAYSYLNNLPHFYDNYIGYDWTLVNPSNVNIDFGEVKENNPEFNKNIVQWSLLNKDSFPSQFFKMFPENVLKIFPAPYFIELEYGSSIIVFMRNRINRLLIGDDTSTLSSAAGNIIPEMFGLGLLSPNSLVYNDISFYWFSEKGIIKWDRNGYASITELRINIPLSDKYLGIFCPNHNQYILHYYDYYTTINQYSIIENNVGEQFLDMAIYLDKAYIITYSKIIKYDLSDIDSIKKAREFDDTSSNKRIFTGAGFMAVLFGSAPNFGLGIITIDLFNVEASLSFASKEVIALHIISENTIYYVAETAAINYVGRINKISGVWTKTERVIGDDTLAGFYSYSVVDMINYYGESLYIVLKVKRNEFSEYSTYIIKCDAHTLEPTGEFLNRWELYKEIIPINIKYLGNETFLLCTSAYVIKLDKSCSVVSEQINFPYDIEKKDRSFMYNFIATDNYYFSLIKSEDVTGFYIEEVTGSPYKVKDSFYEMTVVPIRAEAYNNEYLFILTSNRIFIYKINLPVADTSKSYVYDIPRNAFTKFTGDDFLIEQYDILSGGNDLDIANLFLKSNKLYKYPTSNLTTSNSLIEYWKNGYHDIYLRNRVLVDGSGNIQYKFVNEQGNLMTDTASVPINNGKDTAFGWGKFGSLIKILITGVTALRQMVLSINSRTTER